MKNIKFLIKLSIIGVVITFLGELNVLYNNSTILKKLNNYSVKAQTQHDYSKYIGLRYRPEEEIPSIIKELPDKLEYHGGWLIDDKEPYNGITKIFRKVDHINLIFLEKKVGTFKCKGIDFAGNTIESQCPIWQILDVISIPELNHNDYTLISRYTFECKYPNGKILVDPKVIVLAKWNKNGYSATPIKSWVANLTTGEEKWIKPSLSLIRNLTCYDISF